MKPPQRDGDGYAVSVGRGSVTGVKELAAPYPGAARATGRIVRMKSESLIFVRRITTRIEM